MPCLQRAPLSLAAPGRPPRFRAVQSSLQVAAPRWPPLPAAGGGGPRSGSGLEQGGPHTRFAAAAAAAAHCQCAMKPWGGAALRRCRFSLQECVLI